MTKWCKQAKSVAEKTKEKKGLESGGEDSDQGQ